MGKSSSSKKDSSSATTTPKCICTDPYVCTCTHRPPRPSRGHKWNADKQEWTGKGHRQKGASGQVASVAVAATTTTVGKTSLQGWQKLPSKLLDDYLSKQKRPQAKYTSVSANGSAGAG